jgi:RecA-family ATPase
MLTIFGRTGCNKTALAQGIALGYNANTDTIDRNLQIPSLYLSLEVAGWFMHRRNLQIVADVDKMEATKRARDLFKLHERDLSHIVMQTIPPTIEQIEEKVKELRPHCVIVDYVELLEPPRGVTNPSDQIRHACQKLRSLAVNQDVVVIMLSQTSRQMSREEVLDLYSAKGSGAIENSSSHVLAINGKNNSPDRTMEMLKASDGELYETKLFWTPSFRLKKYEYLEG